MLRSRSTWGEPSRFAWLEPAWIEEHGWLLAAALIFLALVVGGVWEVV